MAGATGIASFSGGTSVGAGSILRCVSRERWNGTTTQKKAVTVAGGGKMVGGFSTSRSCAGLAEFLERGLATSTSSVRPWLKSALPGAVDKSMQQLFHSIRLHVLAERFRSWAEFERESPLYSIALEALDDVPGQRGGRVSFDHHKGVIRQVTMSAAMQAYLAVRQSRLMERWLKKRGPIDVYVWNADQDVCLAAFILEYHDLLECAQGAPPLRWIVQYNNKIDICGGLYPVRLDELVANHYTWVFEPFRQQRMLGKVVGDQAIVAQTIRLVCDRLRALLEGNAGTAPISVQPEILYVSPCEFVIADEKGDPAARLVLAARGYTNLISLICRRPCSRYTYSVIRGALYDEGTFDVPKLIAAFQSAEDQPSTLIWGGSNTAAGSGSALGSSLERQQLRDIAESILSAETLDTELAERK